MLLSFSILIKLFCYFSLNTSSLRVLIILVLSFSPTMVWLNSFILISYDTITISLRFSYFYIYSIFLR
jgi:hypothetical protein